MSKFFFIMNDTKIILFTWHSETNQKLPFHHLFFYSFAPKLQSWTGTKEAPSCFISFRDSPRASSLWLFFSHAGKAAVFTDCYRRLAPPSYVYWHAHLPSRKLISGHWKEGFSVGLHRLVILPQDFTSLLFRVLP